MGDPNVRYPDDQAQIDNFLTKHPGIVLFRNTGFRANVAKRTVSATAYKERYYHGIGEWHNCFSV
jgi:hypothetical protein